MSGSFLFRHRKGVVVSMSTLAAAVAIREYSLNTYRIKLSQSGTKPVLFQYAICPFCHKVKAYLDYLKIDYTSIEVNPLTKAEISFSDYKKVPIGIINGTEIRESNNLIDAITSSLSMDSNLPKGFLSEDTQKWNEWSEKKLAILLYPNITRSFEESWQCFGYTNNVDGWLFPEKYLVRIFGSVAMFFVNGKIKAKHNIVNERQELNDLLLEWTSAINKKPFLHGDSPTLPDILIFGVLHSVEGTRTHSEIMSSNSELAVWYEAVKKLTG